MFKALVARVFRTGAVPPASVKQVAGASETKLPAAAAAPIDFQLTKARRKIQSGSDAMAAEPARLVNGTGPRQGQRPGVLPPALPDRLMDGIMKVLELQKKELDDQQELDRAERVWQEERDKSPYVDVSRHMECLREVTGYTFKEPAFVRGAIFKRGFMFKETAMARDVQLRLALIGDKILEIGYLSQNFASTASDVKEWQNWRWLSSNATLHYCAQMHDLPRKLAECGYAVRIQGDSDKGFGTMMEAIIGAVYEDSGRDGATTFKAMDKLLGTTMKALDLERFAALHRRSVTLPPVQLWWEDLVSADLKSKRGNARDTSDEEDPAMARLRSWATDVRRLKTHYGIKRGSLKLSIRKTRGGRRAERHEQMQQLREQKKRRKELQRELSTGGTGMSKRATQKAARRALRAERAANRWRQAETA